MFANTANVGTPTEVHHQQVGDPIHQVDPTNNAVYQTAVICRLPHQYAMVVWSFQVA